MLHLDAERRLQLRTQTTPGAEEWAPARMPAPLAEQVVAAPGADTRLEVFYVRPEDICLYDTLDRCENSFYAQVQKHEFLGAYSLSEPGSGSDAAGLT